MLAPTITLGMAIGAEASASSSQANRDAERRAIHAITKVSATTKLAAMAETTTLVRTALRNTG